MTHWLEGPILFLDVDGVLNSHDYVNRGGSLNCGRDGLDPEAVKHLQRIVDVTGCALVLSSTWRLIHSLSDMRGRLIQAGMRSPVPLRDKTPCLDSQYKDGKIVVARIRGDEIKQWIDDRDFKGKYVCLDDDPDFHPDQPLVQTTFTHGLTAEEAERCIDILGARMETVPAPESCKCNHPDAWHCVRGPHMRRCECECHASKMPVIRCVLADCDRPASFGSYCAEHAGGAKVCQHKAVRLGGENGPKVCMFCRKPL